MKQYDLEDAVISCIVQKHNFINELFVSIECFKNPKNKRLLVLLKKAYQEYNTLDLNLLLTEIPSDYEKNFIIERYIELDCLVPDPSLFYEYQQKLIDRHKDEKIKFEIKKYTDKKMKLDELVENINKVSNEVLVIRGNNKKTPDEMLKMIRNREKVILFPRFWALNEKLRIKKRTVNVIGARPSEGKSALAINLFCDLAKEYKCIYFNMEMTEEEVYERMISIESNITIADVNKPQTEYQNNKIIETANKIYNYKYEVINGSKTVQSMKNKIIREQKDGHLIVFIDYIGYVVGKKGQNDRERIGEAVRELNNITKDYDCTIFLIAQINRNGDNEPTMQDLKDSGEIEQTADTIILIHDKNKTNNSDVKEIDLLIPKCRGGKRNIRIPIEFNKPKQRMEVKQ